MKKPISAEDVGFILEHTGRAFEILRGEQILLTGGTGFFGKWLTQGLLAANDRLHAGNTLTLVTRDVHRSIEESPWLSNRPDVQWIEGDVRSFQAKIHPSTIIHAAATASRDLNENQPEIMFDTIVEGTRNVLDQIQTGACRRFLFVSSGAIYGSLPESLGPVPETYNGAPDPLVAQSAYGEAKRAAEFLCSISACAKGFELKVARCFAFLGPYLPLEIHFAAGNFISNVLHDEPMKIGGDGTPLRSYLYAADLFIWLMRILTEGVPSRAYNVGAEKSYSISELAKEVHLAGCALYPERKRLDHPIQISRQPVSGQPRHVYVPSIARARDELSLKEWTDLATALSKTLKWLQT